MIAYLLLCADGAFAEVLGFRDRRRSSRGLGIVDVAEDAGPELVRVMLVNSGRDLVRELGEAPVGEERAGFPFC